MVISSVVKWVLVNRYYLAGEMEISRVASIEKLLDRGLVLIVIIVFLKDKYFKKEYFVICILANIVTLGRAIFGRDNKLDIIPKISCPLYFIVGNEDEPRPPKESLEMSKLTEPLTTDTLRVLESRGS